MSNGEDTEFCRSADEMAQSNDLIIAEDKDQQHLLESKFNLWIEF